MPKICWIVLFVLAVYLLVAWLRLRALDAFDFDLKDENE